MPDFSDVPDIQDVAGVKAAIDEHLKKPKQGRGRLRFVDAKIIDGNFSSLDATDVVFQRGDLRGGSFRRAQLAGSEFQGVNLSGADFTRAILVTTRFVCEDEAGGKNPCNLSEAMLISARATAADFTGARMAKVRAKRAIFDLADFTGADLKGGNIDEADLRGAIGLTLDQTSARGTIFDPNAPDPWSRLRATYTGPNLIISLATYLSFIFGLAAKAFVLYILSVAQVAIIAGKPILEVATLKLTEAACSIPNVQCGSTTVLEILLGFREGLLPALFASVTLLYSVLRFMVTIMVATMRDQEERTGVGPELNPKGFVAPAGKPPWKVWLAYGLHVLDGFRTYGWLRPIDVFLRWFKWVALASLVAGWIGLLAAPLPTVTLQPPQ